MGMRGIMIKALYPEKQREGFMGNGTCLERAGKERSGHSLIGRDYFMQS